ncbi:hypothetical protein COO60DRAFT_242636 [Scenedesmus sp. NREL 46B-D3]|nr:hypothetical protein COO60DRAFT_242636 [Scenedesmus sp. NREL 46B-D3]
MVLSRVPMQVVLLVSAILILSFPARSQCCCCLDSDGKALLLLALVMQPVMGLGVVPSAPTAPAPGICTSCSAPGGCQTLSAAPLYRRLSTAALACREHHKAPSSAAGAMINAQIPNTKLGPQAHPLRSQTRLMGSHNSQGVPIQPTNPRPQQVLRILSLRH